MATSDGFWYHTRVQFDHTDAQGRGEAWLAVEGHAPGTFKFLPDRLVSHTLIARVDHRDESDVGGPLH
ncbi:MAG TPA: hypothetical protein VI542_11395, partial [Candidatus Tectomicrobia bacterium]